MPEQVKIQTLRDHTTGDTVAPRTVLSAVTVEGTEGSLVGLTTDNIMGIMIPDEKPTEGSKNPLTSGTLYNEISKLATKEELENIKSQVELPSNLVTSKEDELPPVELGVNADSLQGFNAEYFASKDDLRNYIQIEKEDTFATKEQLNVKAERPQFFKVIIPTDGWEDKDDIKTVNILVPGLKETDTPIADVILDGNINDKINALNAWALILNIIINEGSVTIEAVDIPETEIPVHMMVVE